MTRGALQHGCADVRVPPATRRPLLAASLLELQQQWPSGRDLVVSVDAPKASPEALLDPGLHEPAPHDYSPTVFWASGDETVVGLGCFGEHSAVGVERFKVLRAWGNAQLARLVVQSPEPEPWAPRVFCGFAFSAHGALAPEWQPFGEAKAVLPRVTYVSRAGSSRLYMIVGEEERHNLELHLKNLDRLRQCLAELRAPSLEPGLAPDHTEHMPPEQWQVMIESALSAIDNGRLRKVVAARVGQLTFPQPLSLSRTMSALAETHPDSTRFVFLRQSLAFLGATPERLLRKQGRRLETEALAGTFSHPAGLAQATPLEQLTSEGTKERSEHLPVLEAILQTLAPLCSEIRYARDPELRSLKHMLHLRTAVQAELNTPIHILELVERLHPTPAVGGVPAQAAIQWIVENEHFARGWYAGPIGWFDQSGDGQFDVALRSGIVSGRRALLFAGAGIVKGSAPEREFEETELKFRGLQTALRTLRRPD